MAYHDPQILERARSLIEAQPSRRLIQLEVLAAVRRNEQWRGRECLNLLAPEAPTSPTVRALLASEVGTRAAEGHIGPEGRWFAGTRYIDEIEALCVELLKRLFRCRYADHRLVAGMIGNLAVYSALTRPGDAIMSLPQPAGGHSSNRSNGPAGVRGLRIFDIPLDASGLAIDLDTFAQEADRVRPTLVVLGSTMTLFPRPVKELAQVVGPWGGRVYYDGAHELGLIAGDQFPHPLKEGAVVLTGSTGKTLSGPQGGVIVWDDDTLTPALSEAIFPTLAATHQVNRVAALAAAAAEFLEFGKDYMAQVVANSRALARGLSDRGLAVLGAEKGFTRTHQVIVDVTRQGGGHNSAARLERAGIIVNKNLIPKDRAEEWDRPSGIRIGTTEVTRYGMKEAEMDRIGEWMAGVLNGTRDPDSVAADVRHLRAEFPRIGFCFDVN